MSKALKVLYQDKYVIPEDTSNILYYRVKYKDRCIDINIFITLLDKIYSINISDIKRIKGQVKNQLTTKIVDCFPFNNEFELLEYRLEILLQLEYKVFGQMVQCKNCIV